VGYRSDVRCLIYGPVEEIKKFEVAIAILMGDANPFELNKSDLKFYNGIRYGRDPGPRLRFIDLNCEAVRWYDSYPDVESWKKLLAWIQENEPDGVCLEYVRVGEEGRDVDQRNVGDTWGFIWPKTTIECSEPEVIKDEQSEDSASADDLATSVLRDPGARHHDEGGPDVPDRLHGREDDRLQPGVHGVTDGRRV